MNSVGSDSHSAEKSLLLGAAVAGESLDLLARAPLFLVRGPCFPCPEVGCPVSFLMRCGRARKSASKMKGHGR